MRRLRQMSLLLLPMGQTVPWSSLGQQFLDWRRNVSWEQYNAFVVVRGHRRRFWLNRRWRHRELCHEIYPLILLSGTGRSENSNAHDFCAPFGVGKSFRNGVAAHQM